MEKIIYDEEDNLWTMYSTKKNSPVITGDSEMEVRLEFARAQKLANAIEKFMHWKKFKRWKMS